RSGHGGKAVGASKAGAHSSASRNGSAARNGSARASSHARTSASVRKDSRTDARGGRKPALTAGAKAGSRGRYGFTAPRKQGTKKRG
ncbi:MAG: hypothetical protein ACRD27_03460, partial [Terracidiphilus sp.]